jgi:helicase
VRYGIKKELLELASLEGVGRIRARILFKHGYHTLEDLKSVSADHLAGIKSIGKSLGASIVQQIHHPIHKRLAPKPHSFTHVDTDPVAEITEVWTD